MLAIKAEAPAGLTIEEAVEQALDLSNRLGCSISMDLNDISMLFIDSNIYGHSRKERVEYFANEFRRRMTEEYERKGRI